MGKSKPPIKLVITILNFYQILISPLFGDRCRFFPSCSEYAKSAFNQYGFWKGFYLTVKRLLKCHPFHPGGFDPIPTKYKKGKD